MAYDLTGRALYPLGDIISSSDFPLADFVPADILEDFFAGLYFTEKVSYFDGNNLVLDIRLAFQGEMSLSPFGTDAFRFVLFAADADWTSMRAVFIIGPDLSVTFPGVIFALRFSEDILKSPDTDNPVDISMTADLTFNSSGIAVNNIQQGLDLTPAYLCGTNIIVSADDVLPVFGSISPPSFLSDQEDFQGIAFKELKVEIFLVG